MLLLLWCLISSLGRSGLHGRTQAVGGCSYILQLMGSLLLCSSLWKDVTFNLKIRDIDAATEAKHRLEERQRAEARERKEKEIQWETRVSRASAPLWSEQRLVHASGGCRGGPRVPGSYLTVEWACVEQNRTA